MLQENRLSAFSQWRLAATTADLAAFISNAAQVRAAMKTIAAQQTVAAALAKNVADKTEAGQQTPAQYPQPSPGYSAAAVHCC